MAVGTKVSYGVHEGMVEAVGKTVADVRAAVAQIMNLPQNAGAIIGGQRVDDSHVIKEGQEVEFVKEAGVKGFTRFTPERYPDLIFNDEGHVRVRIVPVSGTEIAPGVVGNDPTPARQNMNKEGWCDETAFCEDLGYSNPKITLDDGTVIWGYQCWWSPVEKAQVQA